MFFPVVFPQLLPLSLSLKCVCVRERIALRERLIYLERRGDVGLMSLFHPSFSLAKLKDTHTHTRWITRWITEGRVERWITEG